MLLQLSTWREIEQYLKASQAIVIPIGSTEQHGPTGLIGTDALCAEAVARGVGAATGALVAPVLAVGMAQHHLGFPGSLSLRPTTLIAVIEDLLIGLCGAGFRQFFFVNGHGGNVATLKAAFAQVYWTVTTQGRPAADQVRCHVQNWWAQPQVYQLTRELYGDREGVHATPTEIALTRYLYPDLVKTVPLDPLGTTDYAIYTAADFRRRFPDGRMGSDPTLATVEHGRQFYERAVESLTARYRAFIQDAAGRPPNPEPPDPPRSA